MNDVLLLSSSSIICTYFKLALCVCSNIYIYMYWGIHLTYVCRPVCIHFCNNFLSFFLTIYVNIISVSLSISNLYMHSFISVVCIPVSHSTQPARLQELQTPSRGAASAARTAPAARPRAQPRLSRCSEVSYKNSAAGQQWSKLPPLHSADP